MKATLFLLVMPLDPEDCREELTRSRDCLLKGRHFAALEQPERSTEELATMFWVRNLKRKGHVCRANKQQS
jgi:hypothetical protein